MSKKTKITIAGGSKIYSRPVSTLRKKISITIAVVLIVLSIPFCTRWFSTVKYYFSDERKQTSFLLEFSLTGTSTVEVRGQENCQGDEIIIPEKTICCGYLCTVTSIGIGAFLDWYFLKSVEIPSSVTEIGEGAFAGCIGLTNLEIHTSVTENEFGRIIRICNGAFKNCHNLNIVIGNFDSYIVERDAFEGCKSVTWKKDM